MDRDSATIALLVPYAAIAPVADRLTARDDHGTPEPDAQDAVRNAMGRVAMTVRAEVASVEMPIEQVLALAPGDLVRLDARADEGVTIFADSVPVHRGMPGRSGARRAVQITERLEGESS
jgi:flagellar motor switch protein FliM